MRRTLLALVVLTLAGAQPLAQEPPSVPGLERFDHLLDVVEARHRATPDPSDVWAQAGRLGHDAERIVAFVRDEVAFEPYEGLLRGASGALLARAGNALDQALLLRALLAAGGVDARLVARDLDAGEAAALHAAFAARAPVAEDPPPDVEGAARELGVPVEPIAAIVRERSVREAAVLEEVLEVSAREAARLERLLAAHLVPGPAALPTRHYWLEIDGVAIDPTATGLGLEGGSAVGAADLAAQRTTLTFRLVLERANGSEIETEELLEVELFVDEVAYRPLDLVVYPEPDALPHALELMAMTPAERAEALRQVSDFHVALLVDGRRFGGWSFDLEGAVRRPRGDPRVAAATAVGGGMGGLFGRSLGGGAPAASGELHAVRLEVVVAERDRGERTHTRTLFSAGDAPFPMLRDSFLVETHLLPAGESARRTLGALAANADALRALLYGTGTSRAIEPEAEVAPLLLEYADARRRLLAALGAAPVFEGVGIVRESRQLLLPDGEARIALRHAIDLMDTRYAFLDEAGGYDQAAALRAGVAETALEWLLLLRRHPGGVDADRSAWTLLERARTTGAEAGVGAEADALHVRWSDDASWSVDPRTGLGIGRVAGGAGQGMVEYAWMVSEKLCEAMGKFDSLLEDLDVSGPMLDDLQNMCAVRDIMTGLGGDVESLLEDGATEWYADKLESWGRGKIPDYTDLQNEMFDVIQDVTRATWRRAAGALAGL